MKKFLIALLIMTVTGCASMTFLAPIGIAVQAYLVWKDGEAHKFYNYNTDIVYRAVKHSLKEGGYDIKEDKPDGSGYYVLTDGKHKFKIKVNHVEAEVTELCIRIDFMGNEPYAELIYHNVDEKLGIIEFDPAGKPTNRIHKSRRSAI